MYSYFVWLSMSNGDFIRLNVCSGLKPEQVNMWLGEFFKVVDKRLEQLKRTERVKDAFRFRIIIDPSHNDPDEVTCEEASEMSARGAWRLSGEFPGRKNNSPI
jgi:hypothetical protein